MEPAFSVALSAIFLGEQPHPLILLTLLPIMGGVALASFSEVGSSGWVMGMGWEKGGRRGDGEQRIGDGDGMGKGRKEG